MFLKRLLFPIKLQFKANQNVGLIEIFSDINLADVNNNILKAFSQLCTF